MFRQHVKKPVGALQLFIICAFATGLNAQTNMFRGDANHQNAFTSKNNIVFGETAWQFDAGAPIRSSVVYSNNAIFFGSANGIFYALDKLSGKIKWTFNSDNAIHSSAAIDNGMVYFSDNKQTLYCLNSNNGKLVWKHDFGPNITYLWAFDYYYSSPTISGINLLIGAKDGFLYNFNKSTGNIIWKFRTTGIVRSSPAIKDGVVYSGDTDGILYAVDLQKGTEKWQFHTMGYGLKNEDFGYDRRAIISSPVVAANKVIAGCRDGILYAVSIDNGKEVWRMDHEISWVISSVAVKDSIVVTGTSDGHFVQAVTLETGKEIWKYRTVSIIWSSPVILNRTVYIGSDEGALYAIDLYSGKKINSYQTNGNIFSSPVISDSLLFFGSDNGLLYALKPAKYLFGIAANNQKMVYYEKDVNFNFKYGTDIKIKQFLNEHGYKTVDNTKLLQWLLNKDSALNSVIVFASNYFPKTITDGNENSALRTYLNNGGKIVIIGNNPLIYQLDSTTKMPVAFNFKKADSVLNIDYGANDVSAFGGIQPGHATAIGETWGLKGWWTSFLPLDPAKVDIVLGIDENGMASAWIKKFHPSKGGGFVQIWANTIGIDDPSYIMKVAEYGLGEN